MRVVLAELLLILRGGHHLTRLECSQAPFLFRRLVLLGDPLVDGFNFCRLGGVPGLVLSILGRRQLRVLLITEHGGWRQETTRQGSASPGGLDQKNLLVKVIPNDMAEVELRTEAFTRRPVPNGQVAMLAEVVDPDIMARAPEVGRGFAPVVRILGLGHLPCERLKIAVLDEVRVTLPVFFLRNLPGKRFGKAAPLQVRLPDKYEHLHRFLIRRPGGQTQNQTKRQG